MVQLQVQIPASIEYLGGTNLGNGVTRLQLGLQVEVPEAGPASAVSNVIGVYVQ